jgi:hydroxylaminobenzene mutase
MDGLSIVLGKGGLVLFTVGLVIGVAVPRFRNPRMGLSAHLTAVQTGTALIAFALFWQYLGVPQTWSPTLSYSLLCSSYLLVAGLALAAVFGASKVLPIAGQGFGAAKAQELLVSTMVLSSSLLMLASCVGICFFAG